jgi:hypothetical protein
MSDTIEIEFEESTMVLSLSQEDFDQIGAESEEYLQKLLGTTPEDPSAVGLIDPSSDDTAPSWAYTAYEAMWAAAYQERKDYAERIYTGCHLNGAHWSFTDIQAECPHPCPVCFEMTDMNWNAGCGHHVFQAMDEILDELPCSTILQRLDEISDNLEEEDLEKVRSIPDVNYILKNLANYKPWFLGFDCARELRTFSVLSDGDRFGGIEYFGFHQDPKKFLSDLESLEQGTLGKISACGTDLEDM